MSKLLISYRRADTAAIAGRIRDRLALHFGEDEIYMDIDAIPIGVDFRTHVGQAVANADAVLVLIGEEWIGRRDDGKARILEDRDPIRLEVEAAFQEKRLIIPVLIDGAKMPDEADLPPVMAGLAYINAAYIDSGRDFNSHMERLIRALEPVIGKAPSVRRGVVSVPVPAAARTSRTRSIAIVAIALLAILALVVVLVQFAGQPEGAGLGPATPSQGYRDRIEQTCIAIPTPGLDCQCFADGMAAKLSPKQQLVLLVAMQNGSTPDTIRKAMQENGVDEPGFEAFLLTTVTGVAATCMAPATK